MIVVQGILAAALLSTGSSFASARSDSTNKTVAPRPGVAATVSPAKTPPEPPPTCEEGAPVLASSPSSGCQKDTDCKGARICERHECVFPEDVAADAQQPPAAAPAAVLPPPASITADAQITKTRPAPRAISAEECAPMAAAALVSGAEVRAGPNPAAARVATLAHLTPACVGSEKQGYRRVQLSDGTDGFVPASSVADLTRRLPPAPPSAAPPRAAAVPAVRPASAAPSITTPQPPARVEVAPLPAATPPAPHATAAPAASTTPAAPVPAETPAAPAVAAAAASPAAPSAADCAPFLPALAREGASIHVAPDSQSRILVILREATPVCTATSIQGFSMRRVTLPDSTDGFIKDFDLSR